MKYDGYSSIYIKEVMFVGNTERGGESVFLFPTIVLPVKTYIFRTQYEQHE